MKKIYYLVVFVALAFTACQKQPIVGPGSIANSEVKTMALTLAASDYQLLPSSDYPHNTLSFNNMADANTYVPIILNARDPQLSNGSKATITFALGTNIQVADSLYKDLTYTVTAADYIAAGSTYGDFTASEAVAFVAAKYTNPTPNQLVVLTYVLYTGTDNTVTNSFLYLNGSWKLIYQVAPAEYTIVGEGKYDEMTSSDLSKLPGYFNFFLKNDITIADTVKAGDIEYVSYNYYVSSGTSKGDYQKVMALTYDGSNWHASINATAQYVKSNGTWIPDPTVYYTLSTNDTKLIASSNYGTDTQRTDLGKYGDFSGWATADLDNALILVLQTDFPNPKVNVDYKVTYLNYTGGADVPTTIAFIYNGTSWSVDTKAQ